MRINYLTVAFVRILHDFGVRVSQLPGGPLLSLHVQSEPLLQSAVNRPQHTVFGGPAYRGVHKKAAALFYSLAANHPFIDGNKRTAVLAVQSFFWANNHVPALAEDELIEMAYLVADRRDRQPAAIVDELARRFREACPPFSRIPAQHRTVLASFREMARYTRYFQRMDEAKLRRIFDTAVAQLELPFHP